MTRTLDVRYGGIGGGVSPPPLISNLISVPPLCLQYLDNCQV